MGEARSPEYLAKMEGIMEFYVKSYFDEHMPRLKESLRKSNNLMDQELLNTYVDQAIKQLKDEAVYKFHSICLLVLDTALKGHLAELKMFEAKFIDLLERTLLKSAKEEPAQVTIIIPELSDPVNKE